MSGSPRCAATVKASSGCRHHWAEAQASSQEAGAFPEGSVVCGCRWKPASERWDTRMALPQAASRPPAGSREPELRTFTILIKPESLAQAGPARGKGLQTDRQTRVNAPQMF